MAPVAHATRPKVGVTLIGVAARRARRVNVPPSGIVEIGVLNEHVHHAHRRGGR